jgi:hypothetical protein
LHHRQHHHHHQLLPALPTTQTVDALVAFSDANAAENDNASRFGLLATVSFNANKAVGCASFDKIVLLLEMRWVEKHGSNDESKIQNSEIVSLDVLSEDKDICDFNIDTFPCFW